MTSNENLSSNVQNLIKCIELTSNDLTHDKSFVLEPMEKQRLLFATRTLMQHLEGSDANIWKVIYGVSIPVSKMSASRHFSEMDQPGVASKTLTYLLDSCHNQPQAHASLQSAFKMRIFESFWESESVTADELSKILGAEKLFTGMNPLRLDYISQAQLVRPNKLPFELAD